MVEIKVQEGILKGEELENEFGGKIFSFKGIPYAQPPVGDLRFKPPQPCKPWTGVRNAKDHGPNSFQYDPFFKKDGGSEDCLYLNVYSPNLKPKTLLPVMFYIHGGGFMSGSGDEDMYGPELLIRNDVILVTINYRVGVLGFLCLHTPEVPGNAGMKDQVAALRWVNKNISSFGGDPNNITIFGESAGGASVSYHLISPMSKGLFKRAIAQSGAANNPFAIATEPRETAKALARKLGLESDNDKELYEFFKNLPVENLINTNVSITLAATTEDLMAIPFSVIDEKLFCNTERFFFGDPWNSFREGIHDDIEVMAGYCKDESVVAFSVVQSIDNCIDQINSYLELFAPNEIRWSQSMPTIFEVGRKVRSFYLGKKKASPETLDELLKFLSVANFTYGIVQSLKMASKKNKVYLYKFNCFTERSVMGPLFMGNSEYVRDKRLVSHADDILYLFTAKFLKMKIEKDSETFKVIEQCCKLWTNFAKYGDPTPDSSLGVTWKPYNMEEQPYLEIGNKLLEGVKVDDGEIKFWENIFKEYLPKCVA